MLTIGEFSRICFVTKKTLRYYDEIGLLRPDYTAENGYRYYTADQLSTMLLINKLKSYDFSLPEISAVLANPDKNLLAEKMLQKRREMEQQIKTTTHILRQIDDDLAKLKRRIDIMEYNIVVKQIELTPQTVYGVRKHINVKDFQQLFDQLFAGISQNNIQPLGPPMAFYYDQDFNQENSDVEVGVPVAEGTAGSHIQQGGLHAFATIVGPYEPEAFSATYAGIAKWVDENGYHICGAPFDKYVRGGQESPPEEYITEIYFPIAK